MPRYKLTPERARELRAGQAVAPRRLHGMKEVARLRCLPSRCPKADICPLARQSDEERPRNCAMQGAYLTTWERHVRKIATIRPADEPLLAILVRREAQIFSGELYFTEEPAFYRDGNHIVTQPALAMYAQLLAQQARDLERLGGRKLERPDAGKLFADALEVVDVTPDRKAGDGR